MRLVDGGELSVSAVLLSVVVATQMNIGGATDRPVPEDIWKYVKGRLTNEIKEEEAVPEMRIRGKDSVQW